MRRPLMTASTHRQGGEQATSSVHSQPGQR